MSESRDMSRAHLVCLNCSTRLGLGAKFCGSCGTAGIKDSEVALLNLKSAWSHLIRGKRWTDKVATKSPILAGLAAMISLILLFALFKYVAHIPYIGSSLSIPLLLLMVPFAYALIPAAREFIRREVERSNERRRLWLAEQERRAEAARRQEEEQRQAMLAYQRWFNSLTPQEQQVELMKQHMQRQEQQMQDLMEQNQKIANKKQKNDALAAWAIMNTIKHHR